METSLVEDDMTKIVRIGFVVGLVMAGVLAGSPAMATDTRNAIKLCADNPNCQMDVGKDGVVISTGGKLIVCPIKNGECGVAKVSSHRFDTFGGTGETFQTMQ
jgi:hypothetical protein